MPVLAVGVLHNKHNRAQEKEVLQPSTVAVAREVEKIAIGRVLF